MAHGEALIGVAITTLNRRSTFNTCLATYKQFTPAGIPIFVVDDGSDVPVPFAHHRNATPQGIAAAKNAGIRLLMDAGCQHLFLSDDDAYPSAPDWWRPYVESGRPHLIHQPTSNHRCPSCQNITRWVYWTQGSQWRCEHDDHVKPLWEDDQFFAVDLAAGVLHYTTREAVDTVGGMRREFGIWGSQDWEWAWRIHSALHTNYPFISPKNSVIHCVDAYYHSRTDPSSAVSADVRKEHADRNWKLFNTLKGSTDFVPY